MTKMRFFLIALFPFLAACAKDEVRSYRVAKEAPEAEAPAFAGEEAPSSAAASKDLHWDAPPPGWQEAPAGGMRAASFRVPGPDGEADMSVVVLPGDAGGDLANVNRWRGQIGLEPLDEQALAAQSVRLNTPVGQALLVDFTGGQNKTGLLAAILAHEGKTWFLKMTGPASTVARARPAFEKFLKGLHHGAH